MRTKTSATSSYRLYVPCLSQLWAALLSSWESFVSNEDYSHPEHDGKGVISAEGEGLNRVQLRRAQGKRPEIFHGPTLDLCCDAGCIPVPPRVWQ